MPSFTYVAIDATGQRQHGTLDGSSRGEAMRKLEKLRLTPVRVEGTDSEKAGARKVKRDKASKAVARENSRVTAGQPRLKRAQLIFFTEELADLLDAGLQLEQGLRIMEERQEDANGRLVAKTLRAQIRDGASFATALRKTSPSFDELYVNMAAAGEASGTLPAILRRLAQNIVVIGELQNKVIQALIYPAFMVVLCIVLLCVFAIVLVPQLTELLSSTGSELPMATQILVKFSDFLIAYWWLLLAILVAAFLIFKAVTARPGGRLWWDRAKLSIPFAGPILAARFQAGFCHALGNLVRNGVPLLNGLKLVTKATPNLHFNAHLEKVSTGVGDGGSLSKALSKTNAFPQLMTDMIGVGEQTGNLGKSLGKAAARYDKELDVRIKRMTSIIPTIAIVGIAAVVGIVAFSIITAIMSSIGGIKA